MENSTQRVQVMRLEDIMGDRFGRYSKYIIQDRALPDARDGLKPVQRRILYAMYKDGNTFEKAFRKSAKTVGNVIGNYHPHGDSSVYEAMVRMSQDWKLREPLVQMHGNNGSIDGDPAAAMRYTEARLSAISGLLLKDIDKNLVDFIPNFDDSMTEPTVLPAFFPNLLVNGATGISAGYAIFYWTMNRFYHLARYNAGLSPLINGTGFMVNFNTIKDTGWDTNTLTEDIEFSLKRIIQGHKLGWATDAIVYDEQPVKFGPSWSQRSRWTIGHIQCLQEYTGDLTRSAINFKTLMNFDGLLYMLGSIPMFVITIILLLSNAVVYLGKGMTTYAFVINILKYVIPTFLLPIFTAIVIMIIDKKSFKNMGKGLIMYPLFLGSWLLINFKCLFKRDTTWEKIEHVRDVKINDVEETEKEKQ